MEKNQLFFSEVEVQWMCLHCGFVLEATAAPAQLTPLRMCSILLFIIR